MKFLIPWFSPAPYKFLLPSFTCFPQQVVSIYSLCTYDSPIPLTFSSIFSCNFIWKWNYFLTQQIKLLLLLLLFHIYIIVSIIHGSHTHIPETNHVPRWYIVTAILSLLFMVPLCLVPALVLLFFYDSTFRSMCAVPNMAVFCSSFTSWFPGMSLTYFLNDLEMVPVAPIITGITLVFTFHMRCIRTITAGW